MEQKIQKHSQTSFKKSWEKTYSIEQEKRLQRSREPTRRLKATKKS